LPLDSLCSGDQLARYHRCPRSRSLGDRANDQRLIRIISGLCSLVANNLNLVSATPARDYPTVPRHDNHPASWVTCFRQGAPSASWLASSVGRLGQPGEAACANRIEIRKKPQDPERLARLQPLVRAQSYAIFVSITGFTRWHANVGAQL
jgi:hypothetical protein